VPRLTRICLPLALLALAVLPAVSMGGSAPTAHAAKACHVNKKPRAYGPTYVTSLRVRGTSCRNGVKLVKGYYKCRKRNGGKKGHCKGVYGYRCHETRKSISTEFDALVKCRKRGRSIAHRYTQFT
jgi:hypothetical protein